MLLSLAIASGCAGRGPVLNRYVDVPFLAIPHAQIIERGTPYGGELSVAQFVLLTGRSAALPLTRSTKDALISQLEPTNANIAELQRFERVTASLKDFLTLPPDECADDEADDRVCQAHDLDLSGIAQALPTAMGYFERYLGRPEVLQAWHARDPTMKVGSAITGRGAEGRDAVLELKVILDERNNRNLEPLRELVLFFDALLKVGDGSLIDRGRERLIAELQHVDEAEVLVEFVAIGVAGSEASLAVYNTAQIRSAHRCGARRRVFVFEAPIPAELASDELGPTTAAFSVAYPTDALELRFVVPLERLELEKVREKIRADASDCIALQVEFDLVHARSHQLDLEIVLPRAAASEQAQR